MRIRDLTQLGKNLTEAVVIVVNPDELPQITLSGKDLWRLHENPMLAADVVSTGFIAHRILWQDFAKELHYAPQPKHREILRGSLLDLEAYLLDVKERVKGASREEAWLRQMIQFLAAKAKLAIKALEEVPTWQQYNDWNSSIDIAGEDTPMTAGDETASLLQVIADLRRDTLWAWDSLIDFLNEGPIKSEGRAKIAQRRESVGLSEAATEQDWQPAVP